jgi:hypothetical protein
MGQCHSGSKIKNGYTLYITNGLSKIYPKKFKKSKLLPSWVTLCVKQISESVIWSQSYKRNSIEEREDPAESNMPYAQEMRRV